MKILYGVQATGNGHITRARALNKHLKSLGIGVDYIFSGRDKANFFDMEDFGDWRCYSGLSFVHEAGKLSIGKTIRFNKFHQLLKDINSISLDEYDLIITDFEPIAAWAAKRAKRHCVGIGHQYAFEHDVPKSGANFISKTIMRYFAPASTSLGLHWHHFGQQILPPIAEVHASGRVSDPNKIVVYLGFEDPEEVMLMLEPFDSFLFVFYGPFAQYENRGHIQLKPLSLRGFKQDLSTAGGVICNAGFELSSEAIQLGIKLLIKPLQGQMEQLSNATALEELGLGVTMASLDANVLKFWLEQWKGKQVLYPDVAKAIAHWIANAEWKDPASREKLIEHLWRETLAPDVTSFTANPCPPTTKAISAKEIDFRATQPET
ncbi:MAG: hypothetical protein ACI9Y1_000291 [Lentisphaeria bacterium]|jgi:uncharacterized protein (TIGR00661 family)